MELLAIVVIFLAAPFIIAAWIRVNRTRITVPQRITPRTGDPRG